MGENVLLAARPDIFSVVDRLYAAALRPQEWVSALGSLSELMGADHTIMVASGDSQAPIIAGDRVDSRALARLVSAGGEGLLGPLDFRRLPLGSIVMRNAIVPDREFLLSDYYNDIIRPLNGFNSAFMRQHQGQIGFTVAICRSYGAEDFAATDIEALRRLQPHLTNAIELTYRLGAAEAREASFTRLLDQLDDGVIVTDGSARPIFLNGVAERIVAENDGLSIQVGGLAAASATVTRRLRQAIAGLAQAGDGELESASAERLRLRLDRRSERTPLMLTLVPLWRLGAAAMNGGAPRVAIFLRELAGPIRIDEAIVAETFALTRREAEIAVLVGKGHDLEQVARMLGIGIATVRSHLKRIFNKTDTHRQSALASLVREFAEPASR